MEAAILAPNAEVSMFPWKEPKERIPLAVRQVRSFLRAHRSASAQTAASSAFTRPLLLQQQTLPGAIGMSA